jgi:hypothetical protein
MTRSWHDFNDAEAQSFDLIPKGTIARVRLTIATVSLTIARAATTTSSRDGPAANGGGQFLRLHDARRIGAGRRILRAQLAGYARRQTLVRGDARS